MGSFARQLMSTLGEIIDPTGERLKSRIETARAREKTVMDAKAKGIQDRITELQGKLYSMDPSDPMQAEGMDQLNSLYDELSKVYGLKSVKEVIGHAQETAPVAQKLGQFINSPDATPPSARTQQPQDQSATTENAMAAALSGPPSVRLNPVDEGVRSAQVGASLSELNRINPGASGAERENWVAGKQLTSTTSPKPTIKTQVDDEGYLHTFLYYPDGTAEEKVSDFKVQAPYSRPVNLGEISVEEAINARDRWGATYNDSEGNPLPLDKMDKKLKLRLAQVRNGPIYAIPSQQTQRTASVGGEVYGMNQYDQTDPNAWADLGQSRVPTVTATEMPAMVNGELKFIPRYSTSTPSIVGALGAGPPSMSATAPLQERTVPGATPVPTDETPLPPSLSTPPSTAPSKPTSAPAASPISQSGREIEGVTVPMYNQWAPRVIPITEAASQTIGDPAHPEFKSIYKFAHLADDPAAAKAIAPAVMATLKRVEANPSVHGNLVNLLSLESGLPQQIVRQEAAANRQLVADSLKGHPEWQDYYDAIIAGYATMIGLRAATKASASQVTAESLHNEMPVAGMNVSDSRQFMDKMSKVAMEIVRAGDLVPKGILPPETLNYYKQRVDDFTKQSQSPPKSQNAPDPSKFWKP